ncbi:MAG: PorV/PorQ family protein [candidate division KSB1 bacterium]|nr:PorV/PorQ family protein [candidate division KSB1 bacterium]
MKKSSCVALLVAIASAWPMAVTAQVTKAGTTCAQFLKIGVGARATAMGEAFVATANDVNAIYWNPAGLTQLKGNQATFMHVEWLADISYDFAAVAVPLGNAGTIGMFVASLAVPDDKVRTVFEPEGTGELFGANDLALGLSYARSLTDRFAIGFNGKFIRQNIWSMSSSAVALDIGTFFRSKFRDLKIGVCMSNFGTKSRMEGRANLLYVDPDRTIEGNNDQIRAALEVNRWDLPLSLKIGISLDVLQSGFNRLTLAADAVHPNDNLEYVNAGFEYALKELAFVRAGYRGAGMDEMEGGLTVGGGVRWTFPGAASLAVDYAYADFGRLTGVHRYSIVVSF